MKKNTPFLEFYNNCIENKTMPSDGLCNSIGQLKNNRAFELITPNDEELAVLSDEGKSPVYWGYEIPNGSKKYSQVEKYVKFTPLRQNIILLCAAINNEL